MARTGAINYMPLMSHLVFISLAFLVLIAVAAAITMVV